MKSFVAVLVFCISLSSLTVSAQDDEKYSRRYDNIDVDLIFRTRLLNNFIDCLLDKKPCSPEGKDLKGVLPDALKTRCSSCTKIQKAKALDAITRLYYQHPDKYLALAERYDPTGEYTRNFENWFDEQNAVKPPRNEGNQFITRATTKQPQRGVQANPNRIPTERTRIPSTWITTTNRPTTAQSFTSTRQTLRTLPSTVRSVETIFRELPTTLRFIPTTPPPTLRTTFRQPQTFRQTQTTTRFFSVPVTQPTIVRDPQFKDFPRSLDTPAQPAINSFDEPQTPVFFQREPETVFRQPTTARPAIITQPPITRTQPPAVFRNIQTILRAPEASFVPRTEITQPPIITLPTTTSVTQPFVPRSSTAGQTQPPPVIARNPPPVFSLPENQPEQVFRDAPTTLRAPVQTQTILLTFRTQATTTTAARTQPPVIRENPPIFTAPDNERTQPRFGDSEPRTREIFTDSVENQPPQQSFQPIDLIDNFFIPNGNRPFRRSINQLWLTTGKVVDNVRGMVRQTIGAIAGVR